MIVYDQSGKILKVYDLTKGHVEKKLIDVYHSYIIDQPEKTHEVVVAVYPATGGKDVELVVDSPEVGHWETFHPDGTMIPEFDGDLEGFPKSDHLDDTWEIGVFVPYTEEELKAIEEMQKEAEERSAFFDSLPSFVDDTDTAVCELYETTVEQAGIISMQDDAICELYELIGG